MDIHTAVVVNSAKIGDAVLIKLFQWLLFLIILKYWFWLYL